MHHPIEDNKSYTTS